MKNMKRTAPSVKRLLDSKVCGSREQAHLVRDIIHGVVKREALLDGTDTRFPKTAKWLRGCPNPPYPSEWRMEAINETIGTHGVESISNADSGICEAPDATYCNAGETYADTIIRTRAGRYYVGSWGDFVKSAERRGLRFA